MATVLLVVQIMAAASMIVIILLQRSEGGALGMGGGGGGFVSGRGAANLLTRMTAILAAVFFATSLALGIVGNRGGPTSAVGVGTPQSESAPAPASVPSSTQNPPASLPDLKLRRPGAATQQQPAPAPTPAKPQVPQSQ